MSASKKNQIKKDRERFFLEQFCQAVGRSLQIEAEGETPDFLLRDERGVFGMELAEVFKDRRPSRPDGRLSSPGKETEMRRSRYVRDVCAEYYRRGGRPLRVQVLFQHDVFPPLDEVVARLLAARPTQVWDRSEFEIEIDDELVAKFFLCALPDERPGYSWWIPVNNSVGWRRQDRLDDIGEIVRAKSEKLANCRKVHPRVVLLLHADGTRSSGMIRWAADFAPIEACGFDEVLLYLHPGEAWRLWPGPTQRLGSDSVGLHEVGR